MHSRRFSTGPLLLLSTLCLCAAGCSGSDGPQRYRLSGEVTYDGKPVPYGWIVFTPEQGPGASANIENGRYETPEGFGSVGGLHTIEVVAFDGVATPDPEIEGVTNPAGSPMFTYTFKKEVPKEAGAWDIEISSADVQRQTR